MNRSFSFAGALLCAASLFAQANPPTSSQAPASGATQTPTKPGTPSGSSSNLRGPEKVAQADPNRVVATIDGKSLTAKQAWDLIKPYPPEQRRQIDANLPNALERIYIQQVFADDATKDNLDQQSPYKEQLKAARDGILAQAYLKKLAEASPMTQDPKAYYDAHPDEFQKVKLAGIFIGFAAPGTPANSNTTATRTEEQAKDKAQDVEKKLAAGGDFAALARTESDNKATSEQGGSLGDYTLGNPQLPPDIRNAITKLQAGQVSEPIRLPNTYLIVKVDSKSKIPFDEARAGIIQKLQNERTQTALNQALQKYKIQVQDPDFFASNGTAGNVPSLQRPAGSAISPANQSATRPPAQR
jgi:parvulin-like peptidyl-prolyl isomerase